ncbi:hypothetical protein FACS189429_7720 [Bacteroidia bacterium]|nr:hypothetical protein FACS189429_7720 [Bacteroidia bacterium]
MNWTKKQGVANFREKDFFNNKKWVLIIDESIQFGNKKLLAVLAVPADFKNDGKSLNYKDIVPLLLEVSTSWKADEIAEKIKEKIDIEQVYYGISDNGNNLINAFKILNCKHIEDINHKFSWIIQKIFSDNEQFISYTKEMSNLRTRLPLSKFARILPPNQRVISRYMNLTPLFEWGVRMTKLFEMNELNNEEKEKLSFLPNYKNFITQTYNLICTLNKIQKIMKNSGFNKNNVKESSKLLDTLVDDNSLKVRDMIIDYFNNTLNKMLLEETIYCSSDILESSFGKFKELVKTNKTVGISDLCLCISALFGEQDEIKTKYAMENIKVKQVKQWRDKNIGETLFAQKTKLLKKAG